MKTPKTICGWIAWMARKIGGAIHAQADEEGCGPVLAAARDWEAEDLT